MLYFIEGNPNNSEISPLSSTLNQIIALYNQTEKELKADTTTEEAKI